MKVNNNIKFYVFIYILSKYSDMENSISVKEINYYMMNFLEIEIDRRTIYGYLNDMKILDINVSEYNEKSRGYHFLGHKLDEVELKILNDAILTSNFITKKKSVELIDKISDLTSIYNKKYLNKKVFIDSASKTTNEEITKSIELIHNAIKHKKKVKFSYYDYNENRELVARIDKFKEIKLYEVVPIDFIVKDSNYYFICGNIKYNSLSNYRLDRIKNVEIMDCNIEKLEIKELKGGFNPFTYSKKTFKMFDGKEDYVEIEFKHNILNFLVSEFREDIKITKL
ncbi:MAG: WYL domain-containing protein, partial [Peptostreptococcaceae bacterium]